MCFALYFGNRGFFPETLIAGAREEVAAAVTNAGYEYLMPPADMTRYGAVETRQEGKLYAKFLEENKEFALEEFTLPGLGESNNGMMQLWPHRHGTDGFFIAKMQKGC